MDASETSPTRIGDRYRLDERIGAGAMGAVWRGTDELLSRPVALKELLAAASRGGGAEGAEEARQRLMREGRIGARLQHPHVISMFDVVVHEDRPWLVMEYLPSQSLAQVLSIKGPMEPLLAADVGRQVADGLAAAHAAGVVHRDVKPGNVLLAEDGRVKITDFGVSRAVDDVQLTRTGLIAGTPAFLAPEIARGHEPTAASDVFALGSTLYTAVEGIPPFGLDDNAYALLHKVAMGEVTPPQQAGALEPVLMQLLATDPLERPTASQAREILALVAAGQAPAPAPAAPAPPPPRRSSFLAAFGAGRNGGRSGSRAGTDRSTPARSTGAALLGGAAAGAAGGAAAGGAATALPDADGGPPTAAAPPPTDSTLADRIGPGSAAAPVGVAGTAAPDTDAPGTGAPAPAAPDAEDEGATVETGTPGAAVAAPAPPGPPAGATPAAGAAASDGRPRRRWPIVLVAALLALLVVGGAFIAALNPSGGGGAAPAAAPSSSAAPEPTTDPAPVPTTDPVPVPTTDPAPAPTSSPTPESTAAAPTAEPAPGALQTDPIAFVQNYYGLLPEDTDTAWSLLGPEAQGLSSRDGKAGYDRFWRDYSNVIARDLRQDGSTVTADIVFVRLDGSEGSPEGYTLQVGTVDGRQVITTFSRGR